MGPVWLWSQSSTVVGLQCPGLIPCLERQDPSQLRSPAPRAQTRIQAGKPQWERDPGNLSQGLRRERQRVKNRTCLDPILTSKGGTVPRSHCQQGLSFHFLGLSPESGDGPLPRNSLWHILFLPSPKSGSRDERVTRLVTQRTTGRWHLWFCST